MKEAREGFFRILLLFLLRQTLADQMYRTVYDIHGVLEAARGDSAILVFLSHIDHIPPYGMILLLIEYIP